MKDRMERFTVFPFSAVCVSHSSVKVIESQPKKSLPESNSAPTSQVQLNGKMKSSFGGFLPLLKPNISAGIQKVIKSFKNLSYLFQFYKANDDEERDMEIGFPTDVQHVAHIGWDGFNSGSTTMKSWDKGPELLSLPSISLRQFELAMAAQTDAPPHPLHGPL